MRSSKKLLSSSAVVATIVFVVYFWAIMITTTRAFSAVGGKTPAASKAYLRMVSGATDPTVSKVRVATYNILSSQLADPSWFISCEPRYLKSSARLATLKRKLEKEINQDAVICLQEISIDWAGALHTFFAGRDYQLITANYGNKFNGYMGVGIAVPTYRYSIEDVAITAIGSTKQLPRVARSVPKSSVRVYFSKLRTAFVQLGKRLIGAEDVRGKDKGRLNDRDFWDKVVARSNQMICICLQNRNTGSISSAGKKDDYPIGSSNSSRSSYYNWSGNSNSSNTSYNNGRKDSFVVGTYHMPCMFDQPAVMVAHCALSAQFIQSFSGPAPYILCGDFNIKPGSSMYRLLTEGDIDPQDAEYPTPREGDESWRPKLAEPLLSAYLTRNGCEPDFTNYAKVKEDPVFIDTLDYLFYSPRGWQGVLEVEPLPNRSAFPMRPVAASAGTTAGTSAAGKVEGSITLPQQQKQVHQKQDSYGPLPNKDEPSDHILLAATFQLPTVGERSQ